MKRMTLQEKRRRTISAIVGWYNRLGVNPREQAADDALAVVSDWCLHPDKHPPIAVQWYSIRSDNQHQLFVGDWNIFCKNGHI